MHNAASQQTALRLWCLPGGDFTIDCGLLVQGGGPQACTVPCPAFLIEHPTALVLFDTGLSPNAVDDPIGYYGEEIAVAMKLRFSPEQRVDARLAELGYSPDDVTHVIMSHLHIDHAGGMCLFPHATFHAFADELTEARAIRQEPSAVYKPQDLIPLETSAWKFYENDVDVFGDGILKFFQIARPHGGRR